MKKDGTLYCTPQRSRKRLIGTQVCQFTATSYIRGVIANHSLFIVFKPYQQTSHPYSFHKNNLKPGEDSLGVEIMYYNQREQDQQVSVLPKANATSNEPAIKHFIASPKYVFSDTQLFKDFQSLLYGKTLFKYFDIDHIMTSLSRTANLSSTEQLKVWKSYPSSERGGSSLSFYANNEDDSRHLEFPIQWFGEKADLTNQRVTLNFAQHIVSPPKDIPPKPKRSSTQKTDSTNGEYHLHKA